MELERGRKVRRKGHKPAARDSSGRDAAEKKKTSFGRKRETRLKTLAENFEVVSYVCKLHCEGMLVKEILTAVRGQFPNIDIRREDPGWLIRWAALREMIEFRPQYDDQYRQRLKEEFRTLTDAEVVSSSEVDVIAGDGAKMLVRMLRSAAREKKVVTVGVAGGHTIRALMRRLAIELTRPISGMPEVVHFRALAAGFNPNDPSTDPNAFVGLFDNRLISVQLKFTGLSALAIVSPGAFKQMKVFDDIRDAFKSVDEIDIFVTSGSTWHSCGVLSSRMTAEDRKILEQHEIVGDLLWRPISRRGPIDVEVSQRAFTLVELGQLKEFIRQDKQVLLTLAPCGICRELKGKLLSCALEQEIVTHLVVDTRSAGQTLGEKTGS